MTKIINSKTLISAFFVALLCVCLGVAIVLPTSAEELTPTDRGSCGENATWEYYEETGELKILGYGEMYDFWSSGEPWENYTSEIKNVTIAEGITSIGDSAFFGYYTFTSVELPSTLTRIGQSAFLCCRALTDIEIPSSVKEIGINAFGECDALIQTENGVSYVDNWVIGCDTSVTKLTLRENTVGVGDAAFLDCYNLKSLKIPSSVTSIGDHAFYCCYNLSSVTFEENSQLESIGYCAFFYCYNLTSIEIPSGVTSIGERAFEICPKLVEVYNLSELDLSFDSDYYHRVELYSAEAIHTSKDEDSIIETVDGYQFVYIDNIDNTLYIGDGYYLLGYIGEEVDLILPVSFDYKGTEIDEYLIHSCAFVERADIKSVQIPKSVLKIESSAFKNCTAIKSLTIPASVEQIDYEAFVGCSSLENINVEEGNPVFHSAGNCIIETESKTLVLGCKNSIVPKDGSVTAIGGAAFYGCRGLTSIEIPSSVTSIEREAFRDCVGLTSVTIPASVTIIEHSAFDHCNRLISVTIENNSLLKELDSYVFYACDSLTSVTLGENSQIESIGFRAFAHCHNLTGLQIPDSVISIGAEAFVICDKLIQKENGVSYIGKWVVDCENYVTEVSLREDTVGIAEQAFSYCDALTYVEFGENSQLTIIGDYAFEDCDNLDGIAIPSSVTSIGEGAFAWCSVLTNVEIPSSVTSIGHDAFIGCDNLIQVDNGVSYVGKWVVDCETYLTEVSLRENTVGIAEQAFSYCDALTYVEFGENSQLTSIGDYAFSDCYTLTSIKIPSSVISVGDYAFAWCYSLASITMLSETPAMLGEYAFYDVAAEAIFVPASAVKAYKSHEDWVEYKDIIFPIENTDVPEIKYGDVDGNGEIGASDVLLLRKYMANYDYDTNTSTVTVQAGADADGSGEISAADVLILRKYMANYNYDTGTSSIVLGPKS